MFGIEAQLGRVALPLRPPPLIEKGGNSGKWGKYIISDIIK